MKENEKVFFIGAAIMADLLFHKGRMILAITEILTEKMKEDKINEK